MRDHRAWRRRPVTALVDPHRRFRPVAAAVGLEGESGRRPIGFVAAPVIEFGHGRNWGAGMRNNIETPPIRLTFPAAFLRPAEHDFETRDQATLCPNITEQKPPFAQCNPKGIV